MNPFVVMIVKYVMPAVAWVISVFIPGRKSRTAWREAQNKAWIMSLVNHVESVFPPPGTYKPLGELVDKCYGLGTFPALWAVEGLGNYYAETFRERKLPAQDLLSDPSLSSLPSKSMTMLHAGIGLSFGKRSLEGLTHNSPATEIRKALEGFIGLCLRSARPGYIGASYESLGLVTLILHSPRLARVMDRILAEVNPEVATYMWRGAGRALYFHPKNFIPGFGCPWRGIEMIQQIAPHETALKNMHAGLAWALTVVNMRNPEIMENLLLYQGEHYPLRDLYLNGMASSVIMRFDTTPDDPYLERFVRHSPDPSNGQLVSLWQKCVKETCEAALREYYPVLKEHQCLGEIFHYQSLSELVTRLGGHTRA